LHEGIITYNSQTATLDPTDDFDEGEMVTVVLTTDMQSSGGTPLDSSYVWSFSLVANDGSGIYDPHSVYSVGDRPNSVFAGDLDGDGDLDLATANYDSDNVSVLLNNGDGTFAAHSVYSVGAQPFSVFAGDLDGDGDLDLTTANIGPDNISVLLNQDAIAGPFIRGDADTNMTVLMADAIYTLRALFVPGADSLSCYDAADSNDDGEVLMSDALHTLRVLFVPGYPDSIPPPYPNCGIDPTADLLEEGYHPCMNGGAIGVKEVRPNTRTRSVH
jgi:hypothetical protein